MKPLKVEDVSPVHLMAGDSMQLSYRDADGHTTRLARHVFAEHRTVDRVAIVELDAAEADALGMTDGIAGVFGRAA